MIYREASRKLIELAGSFKAIALTGPRQSGKTTLVKALFKNRKYISLENPDIRQFAQNDPRGFLNSLKEGAILDEVQRVPEIFSYLQEVLDNTREKALFILTCSNNFLLRESISQSLAGRVAYMQLLPFSTAELKNAGILPAVDNELIIKGFYPPVYDQEIAPADWYPNYINTYVERDVRQLKNITNLTLFNRFLYLVAGRCGQELNINSLSVEAGIDNKTAQAWLGILETSYIVYFLRPFYKNYNKVIIKRPKMYFYDTGLLCSLLRITNKDLLIQHPFRGAIFENLVIMNKLKTKVHQGSPDNLYYWRDKTGREIDLLEDIPGQTIAAEIKSSETLNPDHYKNLLYWNSFAESSGLFVLYAGKQEFSSGGVNFLPWRQF